MIKSLDISKKSFITIKEPELYFAFPYEATFIDKLLLVNIIFEKILSGVCLVRIFLFILKWRDSCSNQGNEINEDVI